MAKKYSIEWYDTVTEWVHNAHVKNDLSKTELMKEIRAIVKDCENPVIAIKVWYGARDGADREDQGDVMHESKKRV